MIVDFRRKKAESLPPLQNYCSQVEKVNSFWDLGIHITENLTWAKHTGGEGMAASLQSWLPQGFSAASPNTKELLYIHHWRCSNREYNGLVWEQHTQSPAEGGEASWRSITRSTLYNIQSIYTKRCWSKAKKIIRDPNHHDNCFFCAVVREVLSLPEGQYSETEKLLPTVHLYLEWGLYLMPYSHG